MASNSMAESMESKPGNELLQDVTRRIVATVKPRRVVLFGSAARGQMKKDSDLDVLVVVSERAHRRLHGSGVAIDIVVATESDLKKYGQRPGTILKTALQEGRILYEA
jgi:predicted nucleotidyltransferase